MSEINRFFRESLNNGIDYTALKENISKWSQFGFKGLTVQGRAKRDFGKPTEKSDTFKFFCFTPGAIEYKREIFATYHL